tara:strand:- start:863 stop:2989 length:2127 start_codon:yes stop_codon:yes gene_type:complete
MKQIIQSIKTGQTILEDFPAPRVSAGSILVQTSHTLVSLGTEKMLVEFSQSNIIEKARQQPEKVKEVYNKLKIDGLLPTMEAVFNKLDQPLPLGYCNVGKVIEVGNGVTEFSVGDRVASNGPHAEIVCVPKNLAVKIPDSISDEEAAFTVVGSIGLQGVRLLKPMLGEKIVVIGLGLIGLLTSQILLANGCHVIGIDVDQKKCDLAKKWGVQTINANNNEIIKSVIDSTDGIGADGVIITASTKSNHVISQSAQIARKKGRIVLIGVVGLDLNRSDFYQKELSFQVSCSYGPGRYDDLYEQKGIDYPLPYVRWTEKRNFEAILQIIKSGNLNVRELITQIVLLNDYKKIYDNINSNSSIASILVYPEIEINKLKKNKISINNSKFKGKKGIVGIIGAGNFTKMMILPSLKRAGANIKYIASSRGINGTLLAKKYSISNSVTDYREILDDEEVDTIIIATRHDSHSKLVIEALNAKKNTFVEKPLALSFDEMDAIESTISNLSSPIINIGFNRRFSPHIKKIKESIGQDSGELNIIANMNAGYIESNHWVHDSKYGGGRIIGEACHLIDLCVYLCGSLVDFVCMNSIGKSTNLDTDNASILLKFENGSNAVINYFSNGSRKYSKERLELYSQNRTWIMDNYKRTEAFGVKSFKSIRTKLDKGHDSQFAELVNRIKNGGQSLVPINETINVSRAILSSIESLKIKKWIKV